MPTLHFDKVGDRKFENGLDRGVLYLPDGTGVVWNGLTAVVEKLNLATQPVFYEGKKISELVVVGGFSASMRAVTYPDEFETIQGYGEVTGGVFVSDQNPQFFALCYRTQVADDVDASGNGYKIHIVYNILAVPSDKTYATLSTEPSLVEMEWELNAVPEDIPGFRPTAHLVIETAKLDPWMLEDLEAKLYGGPSHEARLVPMAELVVWLRDWARVSIIDHGDGTWSAVAARPGFIHILDDDPGIFELMNVNAYFVDSEETEFVISDTRMEPKIKIIKNIDNTWTAFTEFDNVISVDPDTGIFTIQGVNVTLSGPAMYRITDTN